MASTPLPALVVHRLVEVVVPEAAKVYDWKVEPDKDIDQEYEV